MLRVIRSLKHRGILVQHGQACYLHHVTEVNNVTVVNHYKHWDGDMMVIEGVEYPTVSDAAETFGVQKKTIYDWIDKKVIPQPPVKYRGTQKVTVFPQEYMEKAKRALISYREDKEKESTK